VRPALALAASVLAIALAIVAVHRTGIREVVAQAVPADAAPPGEVTDPHAVASLRFEGVGLPLAALERALTTRVGAPLRQDDLTHDRAALVALLQARGHLAAEVTDVRITWSNGAHVTFAITAGGVYRVDSVRVEGAHTRRFAELAAVPTLLAGQPWHPERAAANVALLRDWLAQRRVTADVTARRVVDHALHTVDVVFVVR
jgi:outer membrane translocation and assembly module TamA